MEEELNNLVQAMKKLIYKVMDILKEQFQRITKFIKEFFDSIDYEKYIRYKKYQKRVNNRKILYAKRKAKYGK